MVGGKFQRRVLKAFAEENFENITSDAEADSFIAAARPLLEQLNAMERKAVQLGRYLPDDMQEAREVLTEALKPNSTFDWALLYPSWMDNSDSFKDRIDKALGRAAPEVAAAEAPKSSSPRSGAQPSGTNEASKYNKQGVNDGRSDVDAGDSGRSQRRIVRLADDRRKSLAQELRSEGNEVYSRPVRFGPGGLGATRQYFLATATDVHSAIVPGQLHALVQRYLASPRYAGRSADVLNFFAIQRATYNRESGEFLTFGPDDASYTGAQVLEKLGLLGVADAPSANRTMYRVEGVKPSETAEFLANHLAYAKNALGQDKLYVNWERIMAAMYSNQKQQKPLSGLLFASATKQACCTGVTGGGIAVGWRAALRTPVRPRLGICPG